ncbi:MAG: pyridoxamine 5'-phosphate oxidase family protein [Pseudomonadota bacterium]
MNDQKKSLDIRDYWPDLVGLVNQSLRTNRHVSVATVNPDGTPHVTPIGSLVLLDGCRGFYWEEFPRNLPRNLDKNASVCVMAIDGGKKFWLTGLARGAFGTWPGVRLYGTAGPRRRGTPEELERWKRRVRALRFFKGYKLLWERGQWVRDLQFDRFEPVLTGDMTRGLP